MIYFCKKHFDTVFTVVFLYIVKANNSVLNNNNYTNLIHTKKIDRQ